MGCSYSCFFFIFGRILFLQQKREKLRRPGTEPLTWGCPPSLQSCALPTKLSAGIQAFCLIDMFGEATLYGQFMLVHNSVPACCALVVSFLSDTSCFLVSYVFLSRKLIFFGDTTSNLGRTDIFLQYTPSVFRMGSRQLHMLSVWVFLLDELKLCGQIILFREFDRKAGLLCGLYLLLCFFLDFWQPIVPSTQNRKILPTRNRTGT